ncbi:MAG: hypothetical protein EZS28_026165 [Streblomastix strix]|uniref:Uncharacterized protein n=1 Tax=Streblomastix strix TaxID=222440 RepID=A0A5J4V6E8_9EUKA|nr:MAG: hypothetical protein EZS28_026165 [Streblomastix strix]
MDAINENNQQTHTNFEDKKDRIIEQLTHTLQQDEPRLVPKGREFEYIYSVVHDNDDIDGNSFKVHGLLKRSAKCYPHLGERSTLLLGLLLQLSYQAILGQLLHRLRVSLQIPEDSYLQDQRHDYYLLQNDYVSNGNIFWNIKVQLSIGYFQQFLREYMAYDTFLSSLVCAATKSDPCIELRFILRQFNKRLKMEQIKQIIELAETNNQEAVIQLMNMLEGRRKRRPTNGYDQSVEIGISRD